MQFLLSICTAARVLCPGLHLSVNFLGAFATLAAGYPFTSPPKGMAVVQP